MYDIIIPVATKDCDFLPRVVSYIRKYLTDAEFIYIITNEQNFSRFKKLLKSDNLVRLLNENNIINELSYDQIKQYLANKKVYEGQGWYFQQFLKMGFAQTEYAKSIICLGMQILCHCLIFSILMSWGSLDLQ